MHEHHDKPASFHSSPQEAMQAPPEEFLYLACLHEGTGVEEPDFLAVVDAEEGEIVHELPMPNVGDELHHFGWNRCSSACHGPDRSHLIVPGFRSSRIHIVNVADDPRRPRIEKVIEPEEVVAKTGYTRPHTVHCMPGDNIVISMLGDADGNGAGGFAVLDAKTFEVKGRWENGGETPPLQLRLLVPAAQERARLVRVRRAERLREGLRPRRRRRRPLRAAGSTSGTSSERTLEQTIDLGENGLVPLEVRWLHDPDAEQGFVGAALSSTMWRFHRDNGAWAAEQVIEVEGVELEGWPFPVPGLITDLVLSMDDRFLYFSNWLHGDLRQYDVSDPANPKLTGQLWLGGVLGKPSDAGRELNGGPNMLQLSYDGRRLYVTNSLYSTWDNQFYPGHALLAAADQLRSRTAAWRSTPTSSSTSTTGPAAPRARTRCASRTATARRRSSSDRRARHAAFPSRRASSSSLRPRRSDRDGRRDRRPDDARPATTMENTPGSQRRKVVIVEGERRFVVAVIEPGSGTSCKHRLSQGANPKADARGVSLNQALWGARPRSEPALGGARSSMS